MPRPKTLSHALFGRAVDESALPELVASQLSQVNAPNFDLHTGDVIVGPESWRIKKTELTVGLAELHVLGIFLGQNELAKPES